MAFKYYDLKKIPTPKSLSNENYYLREKDPLIAAFNVALHLGMPLLLTGAPGTGKTKFAAHIANRFNLDLLSFYAKTTSSAADLFYSYDALRHFNLSRNMGTDFDNDLLKAGIIKFNAFGEAIRIANEQKKHSVVLIDEIDKAPRDFPNDLLNELEGDFGFYIPEMSNKLFSATNKFKPIVIITSNSEKNLPEPFLRRCVYYHIPFPNDETTLLNIIKNNINKKGNFSDDDIKELITYFFKIRDIADQRGSKMPATAELISWISLLHDLGFNVADLKNTDSEALKASFTVIAKDDGFRDVLVNHNLSKLP